MTVFHSPFANSCRQHINPSIHAFDSDTMLPHTSAQLSFFLQLCHASSNERRGWLNATSCLLQTLRTALSSVQRVRLASLETYVQNQPGVPQNMLQCLLPRAVICLAYILCTIVLSQCTVLGMQLFHVQQAHPNQPHHHKTEQDLHCF